MFESLKKFKELDDFVQVWPGHGAGSACGKSLGAVPSSTVGYEKLVNWALNIENEQEFTKMLLHGQPEPPLYFAKMKKMNKTGPAILGGLPHPARLSQTQFKDALNKNITLVDTRDKLSFAGGHVAGAINISDNSSFTTWAGWLLDYGNPFILVAPEHRIPYLTKALIRIGLDNIYGYISDMDAWANACHELETVNQITVKDFNELMKNEDIQPLDVRGIEEYKSGHINGSINIHTGHIIV